MEKHIALVRKSDQRVENILIVDSLNSIDKWATDALDVVPVTDSTPYVHGLWDGVKFHSPDNDYLKSIGLIQDVKQDAIVDNPAKAALLEKLGINEEEARLLLG